MKTTKKPADSLKHPSASLHNKAPEKGKGMAAKPYGKKMLAQLDRLKYLAKKEHFPAAFLLEMFLDGLEECPRYGGEIETPLTINAHIRAEEKLCSVAEATGLSIDALIFIGAAAVKSGFERDGCLLAPLTVCSREKYEAAFGPSKKPAPARIIKFPKLNPSFIL